MSMRLVTHYLPELEQTGWRGATLQQVLDMTTGVRFSEEYTNPYSDIGQSDVASGWKPIPPDSDAGFKWPRHMWELITGLSQTVDVPMASCFPTAPSKRMCWRFAWSGLTGKRLPQLVSEELVAEDGGGRERLFHRGQRGLCAG